MLVGFILRTLSRNSLWLVVFVTRVPFFGYLLCRVSYNTEVAALIMRGVTQKNAWHLLVQILLNHTMCTFSNTAGLLN